jgi:hypothetical protein
MDKNIINAFKYLLDYTNMRIEQMIYHHNCEYHGDRDDACRKEKRAKSGADDLFKLFNRELRK